MSNSKISALTFATTPLAGTEVLPIVQSGATVKVANNDLRPKQIQSNATSGVLQITGPTTGTTRIATVPDANFTAARTDAAQSFTGNQTLSTGNLVQGTAGQGVNFTANTPASGMTSQLLNWYEEGTWTPVVKDAAAGNAATAAASGGYYTKIGQMVYYTIRLININTTGLTLTNQIFITGLPFTCKNDVRATAPTTVHAVNITSTAGNLLCETNPGTTYTNLYNGTTTGSSNALVSQIVSGSGQLFISGNYIAA